jgi:hypothetical protein
MDPATMADMIVSGSAVISDEFDAEAVHDVL